MTKFILELKEGATFEEIFSISDERRTELTAAIEADTQAIPPQTQPEGLQIICKHCRNVNELVYYIFLVGKQFGTAEALEGGGLMNLRSMPDGRIGLEGMILG